MKKLLLFFTSAFFIAGLCAQCPTPARTVRMQGYTTGTDIYRPDVSSWQPGDTIKIMPTTIASLELYGGGGSACDPIVIVANTNFSADYIRFKGGAHYYKLYSTGAGLDTTTVRSIHSKVVACDGADHITVYGPRIQGGDIGFYNKMNVDPSNTQTWYPNYPQTANTIYGAFISDIDGEGMYMGLTQENGYTVTSPYTGVDTVIVGNRNDSTTISHCYLTRINWDGIQLAHGGYGSSINNNIVTNYGLLDYSDQQAGVTIGGDTNGDIYNNVIKNGNGVGIAVFGFGSVNIYNNTLDSTGRTVTDNGDVSLYAAYHTVTYISRPPLTLNIHDNSFGHPNIKGAIHWATNGNESAGIVNNNTFCIPGATGGWQGTYIKLDVAGTTNTNNTLFCAVTPPVGTCSNCIIGLFKFK